MFEMLATFYSLLERLPREIGISVRFFPRRRSGLSPPSTLPSRYTPCPFSSTYPPRVRRCYWFLREPEIRTACTYGSRSVVFSCLSSIDLDLFFFLTVGSDFLTLFTILVSELFILYHKCYGNKLLLVFLLFTFIITYILLLYLEQVYTIFGGELLFELLFIQSTLENQHFWISLKRTGFASGLASHGQVVRLSQQEIGIQMII